ncbi:MAG: hypothetical protein ACI837_000668 [Crocinitomicaceae bacterium]|jgi:hypothetical protein
MIKKFDKGRGGIIKPELQINYPMPILRFKKITYPY